MLLLDGERVGGADFLYHVVVFADDDGNLGFEVFIVGLLVCWELAELVDDGLIARFLLFAFYYLLAEFIYAFSLAETLSSAHLVFTHELLWVFVEFGFEFVILELADGLLIA